jgi:hypothetical protein
MAYRIVQQVVFNVVENNGGHQTVEMDVSPTVSTETLKAIRLIVNTTLRSRQKPSRSMTFTIRRAADEPA